MRGATEGEALFRSVFENSAIGLCLTELDGRVYPNAAFAEMLGYERGELVGKNWRDFTHPDDIGSGAELAASLLAGTMTSGRTIKRYVHRSGRLVWAEVTTKLHRDADGVSVFFITSVLDVTERKALEDGLLLRGAILATEHEALPEGILAVDADGKVLSYNRRFLEMCGVSKEAADCGDDQALLRRAVAQTADPDGFRASIEEIRRTPLRSSQDEFELKDGRTIDRSSSPMITEKGENLGRLWCFRDVTEAKRRDAALLDRLCELERWQDLMLDREERIASLKREVNEWCRRAGEGPRYPSQVDEVGTEDGAYKVTGEMAAVSEPGGSRGEER